MKEHSSKVDDLLHVKTHPRALGESNYISVKVRPVFHCSDPAIWVKILWVGKYRFVLMDETGRCAYGSLFFSPPDTGQLLDDR